MKIQDVIIGADTGPLPLILGPCAIESRAIALEAAERLLEICPVPFIFKGSFDKANRSSISSFRGLGIEEGLEILLEVKQKFNLPVTTDIHSPEQAGRVGKVCDLIQIPAFLCRQTDLLVAAAKTGRPLHIKKGQFMAPLDMRNVVEKVRSHGNDQIILTERGFCLGYNNLVCDMRSIPLMQSLGCPVCFDASHSVQLPTANGLSSGGDIAHLPTLAKAAIAAGANMIYLETHPNPDEALCDKQSQWPLDKLKPLLEELIELYEFCRSKKYAKTN